MSVQVEFAQITTPSTLKQMCICLKGVTFGVRMIADASNNIICANRHGRSSLNATCQDRHVSVLKCSSISILKLYTLIAPQKHHRCTKKSPVLENVALYSSSLFLCIEALADASETFSTVKKVRPNCSSFHITICTEDPRQ